MRCAERRLGDQRAPGRQRPGDRVDRGDLQRGSGLKPGQHGGIRSASMVLPTPGGPSSIRWWPPAAQISAARRASAARPGRPGPGRGATPARCRCGRRRSCGRQVPPRSHLHPGGPGHLPPVPAGSPRWAPTAKPCEQRAQARGGDHAQSRHQRRLGRVLGGHGHGPKPAAAAAATAGSTPRTGRILPSSPSSPRNIRPPVLAGGTAPAALRIATAMPRSKLLPRLGRLAGDSPTVIRRCGHFSGC